LKGACVERDRSGSGIRWHSLWLLVRQTEARLEAQGYLEAHVSCCDLRLEAHVHLEAQIYRTGPRQYMRLKARAILEAQAVQKGLVLLANTVPVTQ
jgi:hypothetical protein